LVVCVANLCDKMARGTDGIISVKPTKYRLLRQFQWWKKQVLFVVIMDTEEKATKREVVEKKVYEEGGHEYASKGVAGAGLGLGIAGTALGLMALWGRSGSLLGGSSTPENININTEGSSAGGSADNSPSSFQAWEKACDDALQLTNTIWGLKTNTQQQMYAHRETDISEKFQLYKSQIDADHSLYRSQVEADFGLYKSQRDLYDVLNERYGARFSELDKKVAVLEATRPYQDRLIQCEIDKAFNASICYTDKKTAYSIKGQLVLPSTPTVTGYGSYFPTATVVTSSSGSTTA